MADRSVDARNEAHESEASQALMFCFDNTSIPRKVLLRRRSGLCQCCQKGVKYYAAEKVFFSFSSSPLREKQTRGRNS